MRLVMRDRGFHGGNFARQAPVIDSRSPANPIFRRTPIERVINGCRNGRIADAHFAKTQKIDISRRGFHPKGKGRGSFLLFQSRGFGNVLCGHLEGQVEDLQADPIGRAYLIDGGTTGGEIVFHRACDRGRIGRDAIFDDTVIGRENRDKRPVDRWGGLALPRRQESDDVLKPAQRARRFGQHCLALMHGQPGGLRRRGHEGNQFANGVRKVPGRALHT